MRGILWASDKMLDVFVYLVLWGEGFRYRLSGGVGDGGDVYCMGPLHGLAFGRGAYMLYVVRLCVCVVHRVYWRVYVCGVCPSQTGLT